VVYRRIKKANIVKKIDLRNIKFKINYDILVDVLYISFGNTRSGIAIEITSGDFIRVDPYTDEIIGVTILDFKERYMT
jgi:hypothetical protein